MASNSDKIPWDLTNNKSPRRFPDSRNPHYDNSHRRILIATQTSGRWAMLYATSIRAKPGELTAKRESGQSGERAGQTANGGNPRDREEGRDESQRVRGSSP